MASRGKPDTEREKLTRRDVLKGSGAALGTLAIGSVLVGAGAGKADAECIELGSCYPDYVDGDKVDAYGYFNNLDPIEPWWRNAHPVRVEAALTGFDVPGGVDGIAGTKLEPNEMRITFLGSAIPMPRRAQQEMSVFVEVGWDEAKSLPLDQFVFDCGAGVSSNYCAAKINFWRMDKVFLAHLHGDHMSDLSHIYCFGPSADRKSPLYVFGPGPSGVKSPRPPRRLYDDGTKAFCKNLREAMRWHSESFSFQPTAYEDYPRPTQESWGLPCRPVPVGDDPADDGFALVPIELDWTRYGAVPGDNVAYHNQATGVKITHFPVIHCRKGSIGYKLEWTRPDGTVLSMIYTSDTRPETHCIEQAKNGGAGVDVFIHEMVPPPEVWAMKNMGLSEPGVGPIWNAYVDDMAKVQASSHTPQGAFGHILSQIEPRPRLTVATHFPVADDTVACALRSVREHVPDITWDKVWDPVNKNITWSFDLMVIRVFPPEESPTGNQLDEIQQLRAVVEDFGFSPPVRFFPDMKDPKYATSRDQLALETEIPPGEDTYCEDGY